MNFNSQSGKSADSQLTSETINNMYNMENMTLEQKVDYLMVLFYKLTEDNAKLTNDNAKLTNDNAKLQNDLEKLRKDFENEKEERKKDKEEFQKLLKEKDSTIQEKDKKIQEKNTDIEEKDRQIINMTHENQRLLTERLEWLRTIEKLENDKERDDLIIRQLVMEIIHLRNLVS